MYDFDPDTHHDYAAADKAAAMARPTTGERYVAHIAIVDFYGIDNDLTYSVRCACREASEMYSNIRFGVVLALAEAEVTR